MGDEIRSRILGSCVTANADECIMEHIASEGGFNRYIIECIERYHSMDCSEVEILTLLYDYLSLSITDLNENPFATLKSRAVHVDIDYCVFLDKVSLKKCSELIAQNESVHNFKSVSLEMLRKLSETKRAEIELETDFSFIEPFMSIYPTNEKNLASISITLEFIRSNIHAMVKRIISKNKKCRRAFLDYCKKVVRENANRKQLGNEDFSKDGLVSNLCYLLIEFSKPIVRSSEVFSTIARSYDMAQEASFVTEVYYLCSELCLIGPVAILNRGRELNIELRERRAELESIRMTPIGILVEPRLSKIVKDIETSLSITEKLYLNRAVVTDFLEYLIPSLTLLPQSEEVIEFLTNIVEGLTNDQKRILHKYCKRVFSDPGSPHYKHKLLILYTVYYDFFQNTEFINELIDFYVEVEGLTKREQFNNKTQVRRIIENMMVSYSKRNISFFNEIKKRETYTKFVYGLRCEITASLNVLFECLDLLSDLETQIEAYEGTKEHTNEEMKTYIKNNTIFKSRLNDIKPAISEFQNTVSLFSVVIEATPGVVLKKEIAQNLCISLYDVLNTIFTKRKLGTKIKEIYRHSNTVKYAMKLVAKLDERFSQYINTEMMNVYRKGLILSKTYELIDPDDVRQIERTLELVKDPESERTEVEEWPLDLLDPLTYQPMEEPMLLLTSNKTIDKATFENLLLNDFTDPFTRKPLVKESAVHDVETKRRIEEFKRTLKNG